MKSIDTQFGEISLEPRYFKRGDVIKRTPRYGVKDPCVEEGVGIVLRSKGSNFVAYWTGTEEVAKSNTMIPGSYCLVDSAPLLEAVDIIEKKVLASS